MAAATATIEADAYARLYPDQYFAKFIESGVRPDGRPLALARATSIALRAVSTADASALVKVGATAVLAGVKCEVAPAPADAPDEGRLVLQVEMPPLCSADARPGRPLEAAAALTAQLGALLEGGDVVDRRQLCIDAGRACWVAYLDLYVLDADGSLHDACLLAALAALASLRLHAVTVDEAGHVQKADAAAGSGGGEQPAAAAVGGQGQAQLRRLTLASLPVSLTCGLYRGRLLVDPAREEEAQAEALLTATLDESGAVLGFYKADGSAAASQERVQECLEAARLRGRELRAMLQQALEQAGLAD